MNRRKFIRNLVASCAVAGMLMGLPPKPKFKYLIPRHKFERCDYTWKVIDVECYLDPAIDAELSSTLNPPFSLPA